MPCPHMPSARTGRVGWLPVLYIRHVRRGARGARREACGRRAQPPASSLQSQGGADGRADDWADLAAAARAGSAAARAGAAAGRRGANGAAPATTRSVARGSGRFRHRVHTDRRDRRGAMGGFAHRKWANPPIGDGRAIRCAAADPMLQYAQADGSPGRRAAPAARRRATTRGTVPGGWQRADAGGSVARAGTGRSQRLASQRLALR